MTCTPPNVTLPCTSAVSVLVSVCALFCCSSSWLLLLWQKVVAIVESIERHRPSTRDRLFSRARGEFAQFSAILEHKSADNSRNQIKERDKCGESNEEKLWWEMTSKIMYTNLEKHETILGKSHHSKNSRRENKEAVIFDKLLKF